MWRQTVLWKWVSEDKFNVILSNLDKSGDSKAFFCHKCGNRENLVGHHGTRVVDQEYLVCKKYRADFPIIQVLECSQSRKNVGCE